MMSLNTILLADDNADDVFLMRQAFRRAGVSSRLEVVTDGLELWAYLRGEGVFADRTRSPLPEVLLLDLNMPRLNGFDVLGRLRGEGGFKRLVVHVLTASARESDAQRAYELGANSYVIKPTRIDELVDFVRALHAWHRFAWAQPGTTPTSRLDATAGSPGSQVA